MSNTLNINHLAIIMDGNGRWSKKNKVNIFSAYRSGLNNAENIIKHVLNYKINHLTLFAFSYENWSRPKKHIDFLLYLLEEYLDNKIDSLYEQDIKLRFIGDFSKVPIKIRNKINNTSSDPKKIRLNLNIAFSYSGKTEILSAIKKIIDSNCKSQDISDMLLKKFMYFPDMPEVDLLIRTGGDQRISNFLLWYIAYTELYFSNKYWPDFSTSDLSKAIEDFSKRKRNFGYER